MSTPSRYLGQSHSGIENSTETPNYNVPGLTNGTPIHVPSAYSTHMHAPTIVIDDLSMEKQSHSEHHSPSHGAHHHWNPHIVERLENIVDRIVSRSGPPKSALGNPGPLGMAGFASSLFLASVYNADLLVSTTANIVLPVAFWYGGFALAAAGLWVSYNRYPVLRALFCVLCLCYIYPCTALHYTTLHYVYTHISTPLLTRSRMPSIVFYSIAFIYSE
jgi:hypothetical protein